MVVHAAASRGANLTRPRKEEKILMTEGDVKATVTGIRVEFKQNLSSGSLHLTDQRVVYEVPHRLIPKKTVPAVDTPLEKIVDVSVQKAGGGKLVIRAPVMTEILAGDVYFAYGETESRIELEVKDAETWRSKILEAAGRKQPSASM